MFQKRLRRKTATQLPARFYMLMFLTLDSHTPKMYRAPETNNIRAPESWIQDPGARIQDPGSRIHDPGSRIQDSGSRIQGPGSRLQEPCCRIPGPGSRIQDPGSRIQDPGSRIRDPGSRIQGSQLCIKYWFPTTSWFPTMYWFHINSPAPCIGSLPCIKYQIKNTVQDPGSRIHLIPGT